MAAATLIPAEEAAPLPPPSPDEPTAPPPAMSPNQRILSAAEIAALVACGDALVSQRDIASARLFYERAVEAGDGWAALRMGATFDPAFLGRAGIPGEASNQQEALSWYRRARGLGRADG